MVDCVGSTARRRHGEGLEHYDFSRPRRNADDGSDRLLHDEGDWLRRRDLREGVQGSRAGVDFREPFHLHYFIAQWYRGSSIFGGREGEWRLHALQMGNRIGSAARRCHRDNGEYDNSPEPVGNANDRSHRLLHGEGHGLQWECRPDGLQSRCASEPQPRSGPELEGFYDKRRDWLQRLPQSGCVDLEKNERQPHCVSPVFGLDRVQWQHLLLFRDSSRYVWA